MMKHPMQPLTEDPDGVVRFQKNALVMFLLDYSSSQGMDLNALANHPRPFSQDDWSQLAQLIGYSVSGFGDLSYANPDHVKAADKAAGSIVRNRKNGKVNT